jgi:hypothetical protein
MLKSLTFTKETRVASLVFFSFYFTYGMFRLPFAHYLIAVAIGAIVYGIFDSYEVAAIALLLAHFVVPMLLPQSEGFRVKEGFQATNLTEVSERVSKMKGNTYGVPEPRGVGSPLTEGFEDAKATDHTISENKKESTNSTPVTASSQPAETDSKFIVTKAEGATSGAVNAPENFQSQNGLFKLGQIPSDGKGGFHIDAGTTVMNALNALKPDQIAAMTKDTKQLIETQKSLMGLLQTFQPMMAEGKQMMETFQGMFGSAGAAGDTAKNMLQGAAK